MVFAALWITISVPDARKLPPVVSVKTAGENDRAEAGILLRCHDEGLDVPIPTIMAVDVCVVIHGFPQQLELVEDQKHALLLYQLVEIEADAVQFLVGKHPHFNGRVEQLLRFARRDFFGPQASRVEDRKPLAKLEQGQAGIGKIPLGLLDESSARTDPQGDIEEAAANKD